jgi:hypothetical protein
VAGLVGVAGGGLLLARLLFPPLPQLPRHPDLQGINPLAGIDEGKRLDARKAVGMVGQTRTVYLSVKQTRREGDNLYLYAANVEGDKDQKPVFTVLIGKEALGRLRQAGVRDPEGYYRGAVVVVSGPIRYLTRGNVNRPGIEVTDPGQIRVAVD